MSSANTSPFVPDLTGRVALVTGSTGGGIGRSTALTLARHGADMVLNYGSHRANDEAQAAAEAVAEAIMQMGRRVVIIKANTRDMAQVAAMVRRAVDTLDRIDILVNNAGGGWQPKDITQLPPAQFRQTLEAEIDGAFHCIRACLPVMRKQVWGRVINIGAYDAGHWAAEHGEPLEYAIGKAGRTILTRHLALKERAFNITVNQVNPGPGHTTHFAALQDALDFAAHDEPWQRRPTATPQDIADAVVFLCSEAARFVTGSHINFAID